MEIRRKICLYGNSVILGTLGASFRRHPAFEVTTLKPPLSEIRNLETMQPDVILFDLESSHTEVLFSFSQHCPKLLLVGVSPDKNMVRMWSGQQLNELSTKGLLEVIDEQISKAPVI